MNRITDLIEIEHYTQDKQDTGLDRILNKLDKLQAEEDAALKKLEESNRQLKIWQAISEKKKERDVMNLHAMWANDRRQNEAKRVKPQYNEDKSYGDDIDAICGGGQGRTGADVERQGNVMVGLVFGVIMGVCIWGVVYSAYVAAKGWM